MFDLLIIGSGPAGLSAAIYAKRANLKVAVLEKEYMGTGQIAESGRVDNYPGLYGISGFDLGEKLREHAQNLEVEFIETEVLQIEVEESSANRVFRLQTGDQEKLSARAVIFATGASPRKASVEGESRFVGRGISYCALCDGAFYKGKQVAVLGGGDTALDDALYLADVAEKVYLIHRRSEFRGAERTVLLLQKRENVEFLLQEEVAEIRGENKVEELLLKSGKSLSVDGVFVAFGSVPNSGLLQDLVVKDLTGYVVAGEDGKTALSGLFVAGDVRTKTLRQVVTAVSDGANAVNSALEYLKN